MRKRRMLALLVGIAAIAALSGCYGKKIYELEDKESPLAIFHMMKLADVLDSVADNAENAALRMVTAVSK